MTPMTRLVQFKNGDVRRVALVEEPHLRLLDGCGSIYELAHLRNQRRREAQRPGAPEGHGATRSITMRSTAGTPSGDLLPAIDHPDEPARCLVSGTGLTHLGSAREPPVDARFDRSEDLTDSMKMFRWGVEGGRPAPGTIGAAPEWFYKGTGTCCAPTASRSTFRLTPKTAAKRPRSRGST